MKITQKELRTICHIKLEKMDVMKAFDKAYEDFNRLSKSTFETINAEAFKTLLNLNEELKNIDVRNYADTIISHIWGNKEDSDTLRYVVKYLGFDGIENFGVYRENCDARCMTVYMEGDTL